MLQIKHIFETLRFVASVIILLSLSISNAWGTVGAYYISGFEGATESAWTAASGTVSLTNEITARTGSKVGKHDLGARNSQKQANFEPTIAYKGGQYVYLIGYMRKANATRMNSCNIDIYIGATIGTSTTPTLTNDWQRFWVGGQKSGTTDYNSVLCRIRDKCTNDKTGTYVIYLDDAIMYVSDQNKVDLKKPGSATSVSATTNLISWTNGTDAADGSNGVTGVQKTLIFHRTSGSSDDLTLNDQGWYSLTSTEGPSTDQSGHWTLVSASVAADATSYAGTFVAGDRYAIVHRDLAYNYSNPTYVTTLADACTAPTNVTISGTNKYLKNQDISLTATPTGHTGTPTYQWQKQISGVWTDVTNGDNISGATTNNLQITGCTHENSGQYRCKVSTGEDCDFTSDPYGVHVFTVYGGYVGDTWSDHEIVFSSGTTGTATIHLNAGSLYKFHIRSNNGAYYSNGTADYNGDGIGDTGTTDGFYTMGGFSGWNFGRSDKNFRIYTGAEGNYTITVNIANALVSGDYVTVDITYPTPIHPSEGYAYFEKPNDWTSVYLYWYTNDGSRLTGWSGTPELTATTTICGKTYYYTPLGTTFSNVIFKGNGSNEWTSLATSGFSAKYLDKTDYDHPAWASFTTYTISFNAGGGTGSMSSIADICPNDNQAITANSFTKASCVFNHWTANVDVQVGGATVTAGNPIAAGATIQNINSNITLTAQWTPDGTIVPIPGTVNKANVDDYSSDMTWYGASNEYFDFGPSDGHNLTRWAEWQVDVLSAGEYIVSVVVDFPGSPNSCKWGLQLLDNEDNVIASYSSVRKDGYHEITYDAKWDLSGITPGIYTLKVMNIQEWAQPKLKSITFALAGLSLTYTKVRDAESYVGGAYGVIDEPLTVTTSGITPGSTVSVSGNVLTIGGVTVTAPLEHPGRLIDVPETTEDQYCIWRFDHWNDVPATMTDDVLDVEAVYIPTFNVDYELFGGTIHDDPYAHWYRYTGDANDITPLPENVTKDGYMFGGWYQNATTQLFTGLPGHYYGGYTGIWCLKAHWLLPCDEPQIIAKVTLTSASSYETSGYDDQEYVGTPVVAVSGTSAAAEVDDSHAGTETGYELGTAGNIVFVSIKNGGFRVGDAIRVTITAANTIGRVSSSPHYLDLFYGTGPADATKLVHKTDISEPGVYEYILSSDDIDAMEAAGATGVGVYRVAGAEGQNPCVYSIEVFGCRDLIFDDKNNTHVWNDPLNWAPNYNEIPTYHQSARILRPCVVNVADAQAMNVKLCKGIGNNGSLTINANAALSVRDRVSEVHNKDFTTLYPVAASDLVILSNASYQGALAHGDVGSNTHATVQFYARGSGTGPQGENLGTATWQYMGVPFSDVTNAQSHYYGAWMCQWIEDTEGNAGSNWKWVGNNDALTPFAGYCLTQNGSMTYTNAGTLVSSANHVLSLTYAGTTYKGWNMFANSWMAPINIAQFEDADFTGDVDKSIYLFNTGISDGETGATAGSSSSAAGNYVAVPINTAGSMLETNRTIAPMQGFYLLATGETSASVALDYNKLVRKSDHSALSVLPNRAPAKIQSDEEDSEMPRIIIDVKGEHFSDRLYIFEHPDQTNGFDNGWDGWKFEGESYAPQLMTRTNDLDLAVDVSPAFDGKRIAFRVGEDSEYTLHFSSTEDGLYLRDLTTNDTVAIASGNSYSFMAFNSVSEERFEIIDRRSEIPSGWDEIKNDASFDILDMTVYTADGRLVLHRTNDFNKPLALPQNGTYIVYLTTTAGKHVHKIVF